MDARGKIATVRERGQGHNDYLGHLTGGLRFGPGLHGEPNGGNVALPDATGRTPRLPLCEPPPERRELVEADF